MALSWVFYLNGMTYVSLKDSLYEKYPHLELTPALCVSRHKDCMLASLFFAAVPTGLPRLLRDVLQVRRGGRRFAARGGAHGRGGALARHAPRVRVGLGGLGLGARAAP